MSKTKQRPDTEVLAAPGDSLGEMPERDEYELEGHPKVACPYCEREGRTTDRVNLCGGCGCWFEVVPDGE